VEEVKDALLLGERESESIVRPGSQASEKGGVMVRSSGLRRGTGLRVSELCQEEWPIVKFIKLMFKNLVRTSQETHYFSATEPNRLMFGKTAAVYCENHTELRDTLSGQNAEF
jgi:hypothetical protein